MVMVSVPTAVPLTTMLVGETAKVMVGPTSARETVIDTFCVAFGRVPLAACTVNENTPAVDGVPVNMPLVLFNASPGGTVPVAMLQVTGTVPVAVKAWA